MEFDGALFNMKICKRDGRIVPFETEKITFAIFKALRTGCDIVSEKGQAFTVKVMDRIRSKLGAFQEETGNIYNLEATPAEGTSNRLARIDKAEYSDIVTANEDHVRKGAKPYYTNSTQLPVNYTDDLFEALTLQAGLQTKYAKGMP